MKTVISRRDLPKCHEKYVYVTRDRSVYLRMADGVYIRKRYFSVAEVAESLDVTRFDVIRLCHKLGLIAPNDKHKKVRLTIEEFQKIVQTKKKS